MSVMPEPEPLTPGRPATDCPASGVPLIPPSALPEPGPAGEPLAIPVAGEAEAPESTTPSVSVEPVSVHNAPSAPRPVPVPVVKDVRDLDWVMIGHAVDPSAIRARMRSTVEAMEALLDGVGGPGMAFDQHRAHAQDRAIRVGIMEPEVPLWIIGDLHGDLLALEAALATIRGDAGLNESARPRIIFLGDLFDDQGFGLEVLLRVFELILDSPAHVCVIAGNHDEALRFDGARFGASVSPADFTDFLNANLAHEWIERTGKLSVRFFAQAPRALFFPDGLLVAHAGFPLVDLHARLAKTGDFNDPACLADFVWTRAHPTARRKIPNRFSRGSQFGYQDFAEFCRLTARLERPVTHMVRGHDHVEERYAIYPAYRDHPMLTTVALSRRLPREAYGPPIRVPTLARVVEGSLAQVYRMHIPADLIHAAYPELDGAEGAVEAFDPDIQ